MKMIYQPQLNNLLNVILFVFIYYFIIYLLFYTGFDFVAHGLNIMIYNKYNVPHE